MEKLFYPDDMRHAPVLDHSIAVQSPTRRLALLINPFYPKDPYSSFGKHVLTPSISLSSIAGATPMDWEIQFWDENLLQGPPPWAPFPQVVGITAHLTFAKRAYALSNWYRNRGATVILGGLHVQSLPDEAAPHADAIVTGNGAVVWEKVLKDIDNGCLEERYHGDYQSAFSGEPYPRQDIFPRHGFLTLNSMIATRGCKNRCGFCYLSTSGLKMICQKRAAGQMALNFMNSKQPYGVFIDNNLGADKEYLRQLCLEVRPIRKIWSAAVSLDVTDEPELVAEMATAGCTGVFVGFESLNDQNLIDARKKSPMVKEYKKRVEIFHDAGIQVNGSFVFGFDHDRRDVFERTIDWIETAKLECATFHILTPYPGTPLFKKLEGEGRILHTDWEYYDTAHAVFRPRYMTPEELEEGYKWSYSKLFSHASIWRRRPSAFSSVFPYLAMAYLYKRSNRFWHFIIRHGLTSRVWRPLVEISRIRHLHDRKRFQSQMEEKNEFSRVSVISPGV